MEIELIKFLQANANEFWTFFFKIISILASVWGFLILACLLFIFKKYVFALFYMATYGIAVLINFIIKVIVNRPRPYEIDSEIINYFPTIGRSMPSGHMTSVVVIAVFLALLVLLICKRKSIKIPLLICIGCFVVLLAFSRMYLGQHYLSDLIVAFCISGTIATLGAFAYVKRRKIFEYFRNHRKKDKETKIK